MPELPEVETIARALRHGGLGMEPVLGRTIRQVDLLWNRSLASPSVENFYQELPGRQIEQIGRRGKFLILHLDRGALLIHLRMSGDLRVEPERDASGQQRLPGLHDRALFIFRDGMRMAFNDARKFGRIWLTPDLQEVVGGLGPEPLEETFNAEIFHERLQGRKRQLKPLLLDQAFIAGLGNIYTDEALHLAGLHPLSLSNQIDRPHAERLWLAIRQVLEEGIRTHGASIDWVYRGGDFQNHFRVYQRTDQPCHTCGAPIQRMLVGQRGTHFCPQCQPLFPNPVLE